MIKLNTTQHILVIGEEVVKSGSKEDLMSHYKIQLSIYKQSNERPSQEPSIWKLVKSPSKNK